MAQLPDSDLVWWRDHSPGVSDAAIALSLEPYCNVQKQRAQPSRAYEESAEAPIFGPHCEWEAGEPTWPQSDELWEAIDGSIRGQIARHSEEHLAGSSTIVVQIDNRRPGHLNKRTAEHRDELNKSAMFMWNWTHWHTERFGVHLWIDAAAAPLSKAGVYWLKQNVMEYLEFAFPHAHIHFVDTHAVVLLPGFAYRISLLGPIMQDTLFTASDDGSYFNAGWLAIYRACATFVGPLRDVSELRRRRSEHFQNIRFLAALSQPDLVEGNPESVCALTAPAMSALVLAAV